MSYFWIYRPTLGNCVSSADRSSTRLCPGSLLHAGAAFLVGQFGWAPHQRMRVPNPDCLPVGINRLNTAPTPTGFAEIVSDYFPVLPCTFRCSSTKALC